MMFIDFSILIDISAVESFSSAEHSDILEAFSVSGHLCNWKMRILL
jgi:hypothetical protein